MVVVLYFDPLDCYSEDRGDKMGVGTEKWRRTGGGSLGVNGEGILLISLKIFGIVSSTCISSNFSPLLSYQETLQLSAVSKKTASFLS